MVFFFSKQKEYFILFNKMKNLQEHKFVQTFFHLYVQHEVVDKNQVNQLDLEEKNIQLLLLEMQLLNISKN